MASDREEARVSNHPMIRTHAPLGHVPRTAERLERLDMLEPVAGQSEYELLTCTVVGIYAQSTPPGSIT